MVDMVKVCCAIEKELSEVAWRETRSLLHVTNNNGNNNLKNWDPSQEHKFVTKTRDQPEPGSFFPRSLWDGEMKGPGNEVAWPCDHQTDLISNTERILKLCWASFHFSSYSSFGGFLQSQAFGILFITYFLL